MKLKTGRRGAKLSIELQPIMYEAYYLAVVPVWLGYGGDPVVTEAVGGRHKVGSKHYDGLALDLRVWGWDQEKREEVGRALALKLQALGLYGFEVVVHESHIHLEYDPVALGDGSEVRA